MPIGITTNVKFALGLLFLVNLLNFFDRAIPAVVLESIRLEFGLNDTSLSMSAVAFTLLHALFGIPIGYLADRYHRVRMISIGVAVWSLFTAASGMTSTYLSHLLMRAGVGVGEATCAPAANSLIADLTPAEKRSRAIGLFMLGYPIGTFACYSLVGAIAEDHGWRMPFLLAAIPGFILALLILLVKEPSRGAQEHRQSIAAPKLSIWKIICIPTVALLCMGCTIVTIAAYTMVTFLPTFLIRTHAVSMADAGLYAAITLGVTGVIGLLLGGLIADRVHLRSNFGRLRLGGLSMMLAAPLLWMGLALNYLPFATLLCCLFAGWLLYYMYFVTVYPAALEVVSPNQRGLTIAVLYFFGNVFGGGAGTILAGWTSDTFARSAMHAAAASEMSDAFRAQGLQAAMELIIPVCLLLGGALIYLAGYTYSRDAHAHNLQKGEFA